MGRKYSFICLIKLFFIFSLSCSKDKIEYILQEKQIWENKREVIVQKLLTIGSDDLEEPNYLFSNITDIATDKDNNVYVLDHINCKAAKFTSSGKFLRNYGYGKGQGPGQFQFPTNLCIDSHGNVFISDANQRRISIFDPSNKFIKSFNTEKNTKPLNDMIAYKDSLLFIGVSLFNFSGLWKDGIFQMYSLPSGKYVGSIGGSDWFKKNWKILGGANTICINKANDNIIVSHTLPYQIEVFSKDGSLLRRFGRKTSFFEKILYDPNNKSLTLSSGASICMTCLPDGKIVNVIRHVSKLYKTFPFFDIKRYFDFFDEYGNYLITIPEEKFGIHGKYNLTMASDSQGNIWLSFVEPYPHIAKFKIEFREKKS